MVEVILDASYVVAVIDTQDRWHQQAVRIREALKTLGAETVYFDCVINETLSVIGKPLEHRRQSGAFSQMLSQLQQLVPMEQITWLYPDAKRWYPDLLALMEVHEGRLNFHDALIVTAAKEMGIRCIVSFDADYDEVQELQRIKAPSDLQPEVSSDPDHIS
jgi:predicted nucleic acid-binding protein